MALYWVAIQELPTRKHWGKDISPKIIMQPKAIEAKDWDDARRKAVTDNPSLKKMSEKRLRRLLVIACPFLTPKDQAYVDQEARAIRSYQFATMPKKEWKELTALKLPKEKHPICITSTL